MIKYTKQEDALAMFNRFYHIAKKKGMECEMLVLDMKQAFLELPTVESISIEAEWIPDREWYYDEYAGSDYQRDCFQCSNCGRTVLLKQPHCHCGATMHNWQK